MNLFKNNKALPLLVLLAFLASGFSQVQASGTHQDVTPTVTETPTVTVTETPAATVESPQTPDANSAADPNAIALSDWPQVQRDSQHSGYYPAALGGNFAVTWRHAFQPEKVFPQVQAIVASGKVFVGTEMGNLYALNATNGAQAWKFTANGPILNSVAVDGDRVFFGAMDGAVYAVDANTGNQVWKAQLSQFLGFSTAPVIADGKVMLGGRNGIFYALNPANGNVIWSYNAGSPILMTAAWNSGKAYFGTMDMYVHGVNTANGTQAWKSPRIPGLTFKDYWPVVTGGMVYVRPMNFGYVGFDSTGYSQILSGSAQNQLLAQYASNPANFETSLARLNESNGQLAPMVIHYNFQTMNGATAPPCVNRDGSNLVMPIWLPVREWFTGWGLLNPSSRIMVDAFTDGNDGGGNNDENMAVTCAQNMVIAMHIEEENANFTGFFNLDSRQWTRIAAGAQNRQMSNNTQGGGANPASIANGWVYHISFYELIARNTNQ
ncbi:MAG TPA: PQQ-binding-like beta-propeller repeat protein [Longilinea sp.]|nr:PQQ-binding-like beta-propeller repeat protein [Longilinea sp.]